MRNDIDDGDTTVVLEGMSDQEKFKFDIFYVVIDKLKSTRQKRIEAFSKVLQRFVDLTHYESILMKMSITRPIVVYSRDLSSDFLQNFVSLYAGIKIRISRYAMTLKQKELEVIKKCLQCSTLPIFLLLFQTQK